VATVGFGAKAEAAGPNHELPQSAESGRSVVYSSADSRSR
jgi:hypothetical protein